MVWLLDTNVLSELRRPIPEPKIVAFVILGVLAARTHALFLADSMLG
jgi:predicted nucleic acid-binding protein